MKTPPVTYIKQSLKTQLSEKNLILLLAAMQFTHIVDFMVLSPLGPTLMRQYGVSASAFATAVAVYGLTAGIACVVMAGIADRFNRKSLLLVMFIGFIGSTLACAFAPSYEWLLVARAFAGATGGVIASCAQAIVADMVPPDRRGRAMATLGSAFAMASVMGVPIGIFLAAHWGWHTPFMAIAVVATLLALIFAKKVTIPRLAVTQSNNNPFKQLWAVLKERNHWPAFALTVMLTTATFMIIPFISVYLVTNVKLAETDLSYIYLFGGAAVLICAPFIGRAADQYGKQFTFQCMAIFSLLPVLLITNAGPWGLIAAVCMSAMFFVGTSGRWMPALALATGSAQPSMRGGFSSLQNAIQHGTAALATTGLGFIVQVNGKGEIEHYNYAGYLSCALVIAAIFISKRIKAIG
jgi:predicted MFS family arabinose efflux permease